MALYFDMTALPPADQLRVARRRAEIHPHADDRGRPGRHHAFPGRRGQRAAGFHRRSRPPFRPSSKPSRWAKARVSTKSLTDDSAADTGAAFGQDDSEFNIFNTDRQLAALQTAATMLGQLSEKKSLLYFASGIHLNGMDNQAQMHATVNAAIRAGVSFWPIDARGLVAHCAAGRCDSRGSPGGPGMYSGTSSIAFTGNFQASQDTLYALAGDTGGKALLDNNDLAAGIVNAQKAVSSYYIIGYYTSNQNLDGKFRRVKITLNNGASASLEFPPGLFRRQGIQKVHPGGQGTPARRRPDAGRSDYRPHHCHGSELLPAEPGRVLRPGAGEDPGHVNWRWRANAAPSIR